MVLLTDRHESSTGFVSAWDVLAETGCFDSVVFFEPRLGGWAKLKALLRLALQLRDLRIEDFYNFAQARTWWQRLRDTVFFRVLTGANKYHVTLCPDYPPLKIAGRLPRQAPEWRRLLQSVAGPGAEAPNIRYPVHASVQNAVEQMACECGIDWQKTVVAIAPGSKMQSKRWPLTRFRALGKRLLKQYPDMTLLVVGGAEDAAAGRELCAGWGERSHNFAGDLTIAASAALLEKCAVYLGNDTGTMHLAAMVGAPCVGLFSARDYPGLWEPYGEHHVSLRHEVDCAGCMLENCPRDTSCLDLISIEEVEAAVQKVLAR